MLLEPGVGAPCEDWDSRKRDGRDMALPEMLLKPEMGTEAPWLPSTLQFSNVFFRLKLSGAEGQEIMGYRPLCEAEQGRKSRRGSENRPEGGGHRSSQRDRIPDSDKCKVGQRVTLLSRVPRTPPSPSQGQDWAPEAHGTAPLIISGLLYLLQLHLKLVHCSWQESILKFSEILCTNWETLLLFSC